MTQKARVTANERDAIRWIRDHGRDDHWHDSPHGKTLQALSRKGLVTSEGGAWHVTDAGQQEIAEPDIFDGIKPKKTRRPARFSDSLTTESAEFSVRVEEPWGEASEAVIVKIDCNGEIHGDETTVDVLIEMLEKARDNLVARRGKITRARLEAL